MLSQDYVMEEPTFRWTPALIRDLIPTTLCSTKQLFKKLPWDMIESTTLQLSIFDGGRFLLDVNIGFAAS